MTSAPCVDLFTRKVGSSTWVPVDPSTPTGQRLLAIFTKEIDPMSTAIPTAAAVNRNNVERMGLLVQAKQTATRALNALLSVPRSAWNWVYRTFHLEAAADLAKAGYATAKGYATTTNAYLGRSGWVGLGMAAIATSTGRSVIKAIATPVLWVLREIGENYVWAENNVDRLGSIGRMVANGMATLREFVERTALRALIVYSKYVAPYTGLDTVAMRATRVIGMTVLGFKVMPLIAAVVPFAGFPLILLQAVVGGLLFGPAMHEVAEIVTGLYNRGTSKGAVASDDAATVANVASTTIAQPKNRAERRASQATRKTAHAVR